MISNSFQTGNGDVIDGAREQWNDGSNTLCIRPGVVVTYDRNYVSNDLLRQKGIKVIRIISGSELYSPNVPELLVNHYSEKTFNVINYRSEGENNDRNSKTV
ncbi:arginine deiminase family protein [Staphylococcus aureus]